MENINELRQKLNESYINLAKVVKLKQEYLDQFNICMDNIWNKGNIVIQLEQNELTKKQISSSDTKAYSFFKSNLEESYRERQQRIKKLNFNEAIEKADKAIAFLKTQIKALGEQIANFNNKEYNQQSEQKNKTASVLAF